MTTQTRPVAVAFGAATDPGRRRTINEDSHLAEGPLFLVADGMGGHNSGEIASAAVVAEFSQLAGRPSLTIDDVHATFRRARHRVESLPAGGGAGAGTTLTGVVIADVEGAGYWLALNLGDSRTYRLSGGELEQISVDHSVVQELVDSGELAAAAAATDSRRNVITRAIGAGSASEPDYWLLPAEVGDRMLVCSDGLPGELAASEIRAILTTEPDPQVAADRLVAAAVERGGRDNVTVIVVDALRVGARAKIADLEDTRPSHSAPGAEVDVVEGDTLPRTAARGAI
ncbi:protein phosphatase 2C domain-containing protein [Microbacterium sp. BWT-B31]|uniref:PP2C family protein-serine/threonine phosphatase n=1 Tax=Microbacterium sp. BWT-B31 TaxID=3232072 RepID=UPI00352968EC